MKRIFFYIILIVGYSLATFICLRIGSLLPFKDVFWNATLIFSVMNILVAFFYLKVNPVTTISVSILIAFLSLFLSFKLTEFYYPPSDAYGINTTIVANIFFSILFWEIAYQIKQTIVKDAG